MNHVDSVEPAASASTKALAVTLSGSAAAVGGGLTLNEVAIVIGAVVAVLGLVVQWYYRHKEYKLKERESNARMGLYE